VRGQGGLVEYSRLLGVGHVSGEAGRDGKGRNQSGHDGGVAFVDVPLGTIVYAAGPSENRSLGEILEDGYKLFIAGGGEGGHGNTHFASSTMKEPLIAEEGMPGEALDIVLELRLLADVALIGQPNAGKSQLLGAVSAARPAVAEYPFTTQQPELASVKNGWSRFTMVELPGIVASSHQGKGLGTAFLQHLWRARVLIHLVDGAAEDPVAALQEVNNEVGQYEPAFLERPQIVVVNKVDLPDVQERVPELRRRLARYGLARHFVSALTGEGVENLVGHVRELLERLPPVPGWGQLIVCCNLGDNSAGVDLFYWRRNSQVSNGHGGQVCGYCSV